MESGGDPEGVELQAALFELRAQLCVDEREDRRRPLAEYQRRFPGFEAEVAVEFEAVLAARRGAERADAAPHELFGRYRVLHELGRGGQARVVLALDETLRRHVALKIVSSEFENVSPERRERLRREANTISRLEHPGICAVYEARLDLARPFIAMRYVPGETLAAQIKRAQDERRSATPASPSPARVALFPERREELAQLLRFFERLVRAVHAAHEAGVIHRDLKPSNVMVTPAGEPVILDFGLARDESSDEVSLTRSGALVGTPAYMAPEQFEPGAAAPDRRADVYALGVMLYECSTLARPFPPAHPLAPRGASHELPANDPRAVNARLPKDLRIVIATALEERPARRYPSALALAEDLRRICEYEPILARAPSAGVRAARWVRRNRVLAFALVGCIAFVAFELARMRIEFLEVSAIAAEKTAALRTLEGVARREQSRAVAERSPSLALWLALEAHELDPSPESSRTLLEALLRPVEERRLWLDAATESSPAAAATYGRPMAIQLARRGDLVVVATRRGALLGWSARTGTRVFAIELGPPGGKGVAPVQPDNVHSIDLDAGEARIAYARSDGSAGIVDIASGRTTARFEGHVGPVLSIQFDPTATLVATASLDGTARIFDAATGEQLSVVERRSTPLAVARWNRSGDALLVCGSELTGALWNRPGESVVSVHPMARGARVATFAGHLEAIRGAEFSLDDSRVFTTADDKTLRCWDARTGAEDWSQELDASPLTATLSQDGEFVAVCTHTGALVFDARTGARVAKVLDPDRRYVRDVAFRPGTRQLATVNYAGVARTWDIDSGRQLSELRGLPGEGIFVRYTSDGKHLVAACAGFPILVWSAERVALPVQLGSLGDPVVSAELDANGERVVTVSKSGTLRLWNVRTATEIARPVVDDPPALWAGFDPCADRLWISRGDRSCEVWGSESASEPIARIELGRPTTCIGFSPTGRWTFVGDRNGDVRLFDAQTGADELTLSTARLRASTTSVSCVRFAPDESVAFVAHETTVDVWDLAYRSLSTTLEPEGDEAPEQREVFDLAPSPDGRKVAVAFGLVSGVRVFAAPDWNPERALQDATTGGVVWTSDGTALVLLQKWREKLSLRTLDSTESLRSSFLGLERLERIARSPDDARFAASWTQRIGIFEANSLAEIVDLPARSSTANVLGYSRDGRLLVTAYGDGVTMIWPTDLAAEARRRAPREPRKLMEAFQAAR